MTTVKLCFSRRERAWHGRCCLVERLSRWICRAFAPCAISLYGVKACQPRRKRRAIMPQRAAVYGLKVGALWRCGLL